MLQLKAAAFKQQLPRAVRSCSQVARCQAAPEGERSGSWSVHSANVGLLGVLACVQKCKAMLQSHSRCRADRSCNSAQWLGLLPSCHSQLWLLPRVCHPSYLIVASVLNQLTANLLQDLLDLMLQRIHKIATSLYIHLDGKRYQWMAQM